MPCALTLGAFCLFLSGYRLQQTVTLRSSQPIRLEVTRKVVITWTVTR